MWGAFVLYFYALISFTENFLKLESDFVKQRKMYIDGFIKGLREQAPKFWIAFSTSLFLLVSSTFLLWMHTKDDAGYLYTFLVLVNLCLTVALFIMYILVGFAFTDYVKVGNYNITNENILNFKRNFYASFSLFLVVFVFLSCQLLFYTDLFSYIYRKFKNISEK